MYHEKPPHTSAIPALNFYFLNKSLKRTPRSSRKPVTPQKLPTPKKPHLPPLSARTPRTFQEEALNTTARKFASKAVKIEVKLREYLKTCKHLRDGQFVWNCLNILGWLL